MLFSDFEDGGQMWTGDGPRELRKAVKFSETYSDRPTVQVSVSLWDMDQKTNQRGDIRAEEITAAGFTIVFTTWSDTRIARIRASWIAIGGMTDDEAWDVE